MVFKNFWLPCERKNYCKVSACYCSLKKISNSIKTVPRESLIRISAQASLSILVFFSSVHTDKNENKIFLIFKKIQRDRMLSHIWLTASSFTVKYLCISSYIRKSFLIGDFAPDPSELPYMRKILFSFLSVHDIAGFRNTFQIHRRLSKTRESQAANPESEQAFRRSKQKL